MKLLTKLIRRKLPPLYAQDGKGGQAVVYVKYFTPDSSFTWFATEGSPEGDDFGPRGRIRDQGAGGER